MRSNNRADKSSPLTSKTGHASPRPISSVDSPNKHSSAVSLAFRILSGSETPLTFSEAARRLPNFNGKPVHISALGRWTKKGLKGVCLEWAKFGGRNVTTVEALARFLAALSESAQVPHSRPVSTEATVALPRTDQAFLQHGKINEYEEQIERELARRFGV
jgi:hypothetical protein